MKMYDLIMLIEKDYPLSLQDDYDCSGLLYDSKKNISKILVTLDITNDVINKAIEDDIDLIISHHPLIFIDYCNTNEINRNIFQKAYANKISIYSLHTNFDFAKNGMNDNYIKTLEDVEIVDCVEHLYIIKAKDIFKSLNNNKYSYVIYNKKEKIERIAIILGGGSSFISLANELKCDALISSDFKHHEICYAQAYNMCIIDNFHASESLFIELISDYLNKKTSLEISKYDSTYKIDLVKN